MKVRDRGPVGFRTGGLDGPLARRARGVVDGSRPWLVAVGVLALATGATMLLIDTDVSLRVLAVLLGVSSIGQGALRLIAARKEPTEKHLWRTNLIGAAVIVAGGVCILVPVAGERGLLVGTAVWLVLVGVQEVIDREHRSGWSYLLLATSLVAAAVLLLNGQLALAALAYLLGIVMLVRGAVLIARAATRPAARHPAPDGG